ncbi:MAG: inositol monophosphatase family protein [Acidimicrobiales bacterium]
MTDDPSLDAAPASVALLEEAVALARQAGDLTLQWFQSGSLTVDTKADATPVTDADRAAERLVRDQLARRYPEDGIIGEEEGTVIGSSVRRWVVDPIDGTYGFVHGVPLYSTLLAALDEHGPVVGVIHLPALRETIYAGRGLGCFRLGPDGVTSRVSVSRVNSLSGAAIMTSGVDNWSAAQLAAVHGAGARVRTWGDGYGYALVACGRADAMVDPEVSVWDLAPMPVILTEAGGTFTTVDGRADLWGGSGVASNGRLHPMLLRALSQSQ